MLRPIVILAAICVVSAFVLGVTYDVTRPLIAAQQDEGKLLKKVLGGADDYQEKISGGRRYFEAYKQGKLIGYALFIAAKGYADDIKMLIGIDSAFRVTAVEVLSQKETPGLGSRCVEIRRGEEEPWFLRQFKGRNPLGIGLKDIDTITGATITSEAILNGIKKDAAALMEAIGTS